MKYILLLLGTISMLFSIYFFIETADIFKDIFDRGFIRTNKADLLKPTLIFIVGIFFFFVHYKQQKNKDNEN